MECRVWMSEDAIYTPFCLLFFGSLICVGVFGKRGDGLMGEMARREREGKGKRRKIVEPFCGKREFLGVVLCIIALYMDCKIIWLFMGGDIK